MFESEIDLQRQLGREEEFDSSFDGIHRFFHGDDPERKRHGLSRKIVYAAGTAPMRYRSEIEDILYLTDFDELTCVDPGYVEKDRLQVDIQAVESLADSGIKIETADDNSPDIVAIVRLLIARRLRQIVFVRGSATDRKNMPAGFNIFVAGRRSSNPGGPGEVSDTSSVPASIQQGLPGIVAKLAEGGYVIPDIDLSDDRYYLQQPLAELNLQEVPGVRRTVKESRQNPEKVNRLVHQQLFIAWREGRFDPDLLPISTDPVASVNQEPIKLSALLEEIDPEQATGDLDTSRVGFYDTCITIDSRVYSYANGSDLVNQTADQVTQQALETIESGGIGLYRKNHTEDGARRARHLAQTT